VNNRFYSLPTILKEHGYSVFYAHDFDRHWFNLERMARRFGYDDPLFQGQFPPSSGPAYGLRDRPFLEAVLPRVAALRQPFFAHLVLVMGHHPFDELEPDERPLKLSPALDRSVLGNYLQMCRFRDDQLRWFLTTFRSSPLYANTILCLVGDHAAKFAPAEIARVRPNTLPPDLNKALDDKVPFLIFDFGVHRGELPGPTGHLDTAPTLLYLLDLQARPVFLGRNMFAGPHVVTVRNTPHAVDSERVYLFQTRRGCWRRSGETTDASDLEEAARKEFGISDLILYYDLIPRLK
jgi:phosphoglycerol transferase MdoB-like AlkP superfamily enzyme